ncbi:MAG: hypothetical protein KDE35_07745 [Geminicoccaceae bacterium]|nr:hypothetical protein [Geminicoccaceae bacterium]
MKKRPALPRDETELPPPPPEDRRREPGRYDRFISAPGDWIRVAPGFRNRLYEAEDAAAAAEVKEAMRKKE